MWVSRREYTKLEDQNIKLSIELSVTRDRAVEAIKEAKARYWDLRAAERGIKRLKAKNAYLLNLLKDHNIPIKKSNKIPTQLSFDWGKEMEVSVRGLEERVQRSVNRHA